MARGSDIRFLCLSRSWWVELLRAFQGARRADLCTQGRLRLGDPQPLFQLVYLRNKIHSFPDQISVLLL
jgi:hypothetical protein